MKFTKTLVLSTILFSFCILSSSAYSQDLLQVGIDKIQKREYKGAIEDLKKAIEKTPKSSKAHFYLGEAYYLTKQFDNAEVSLKRAVDLDDEYAQAYKRLGDVYSAKKLYREALTELLKSVKLDKKNSDYLMALGLAYLDVDSIDKAIATISQAQVQDPKNPATFVALGDAYLKMNVPVMAVDNYKKAIALDSSYSAAHKKLGDVYYQKMKMFKDALNEYIIYANLDSTNVDNLEKVGHLLFYNKIYPTAITFYEKSVKIDLNNYAAYTELGASYMYNRDLPNAIKNLETAIKLDPKPVDATRYLALSYYYKRENKKAFEKFTALEKIDTLKAEEYQKFAKAALGVPDSNSAINLFKKAIEINPEIDVYSDLAAIFQKQKRNKEAAEFYFKKAERDTTANKVRYYMAAGQFYFSEKELDKAIGCFDKTIANGTPDLKVYFYKAQAYKQYPKNDSIRLANENYRKFVETAEKDPDDYREQIKYALLDLGEFEYKVTKNYTKALSYFDDLLRFDSKNIGALMYRAICYVSMNQKEEACKTLDRVLKIQPNNKDAEDMKKNYQCWMFK
jgi:tetratricopeptide (TPR) repeat protein